MLDMSDVITDWDIAIPIAVTRVTTAIAINGPGAGELATSEAPCCLTGIIQPMSAKDLMLLPEGVRSDQVIVIHSAEAMYSDDGGQGVQRNDLINYRDTRYKVYSVLNQSEYGFYKAIAIQVNK